MTLVGNWSYPTAIRFGAGRIVELVDACRAAGMNRPLVVTDRGLASLPVVGDALELLDAGGIDHALFSAVDPNPDGANVEAGVGAFRDGGFDGVIAIGGGSALDLGKVVAFMAGQTRPIWDFEDIGDWWTRANPVGIAPIIAVPTTAGTGSEVGRAGVITNQETLQKKIIFHPQMMPRVVICDPALTVSMPPAITAGTGLDAFAHCLEAHCSPHYHPMSHAIALEGMRLVRDYLPRAYADGGDFEARAQMMSAALMGATAFQKGLGAIHALSHPIGAIHHTHHGTTNAVLMPAVLRFNRPAVEDVLARAAAYLGIAGGYEGFCAYVAELNEALRIPKTLTELGVVDPDLDTLSRVALTDPSVSGNPVPMSYEHTRRLLETCL